MKKTLFQNFDLLFRLFKRGIIYRDTCCVNWCCHLQSTLSDLEIETKILDSPTLVNLPGDVDPVQFGIMHRFAYELVKPVGKHAFSGI